MLNGQTIRRTEGQTDMHSGSEIPLKAIVPHKRMSTRDDQSFDRMMDGRTVHPSRRTVRRAFCSICLGPLVLDNTV